MTARYEQEEEGLTNKVSLPKKFAQNNKKPSAPTNSTSHGIAFWTGSGEQSYCDEPTQAYVSNQ